MKRRVQRQAEMMNPDLLPAPVRVAVQRRTVGAKGETIPPFKHAEVAVIGVVLLHQHHDVVDARQTVAASRPVRKRQGPRAARLCHPLSLACTSGVGLCWPGRRSPISTRGNPPSRPPSPPPPSPPPKDRPAAR